MMKKMTMDVADSMTFEKAYKQFVLHLKSILDNDIIHTYLRDFIL